MSNFERSIRTEPSGLYRLEDLKKMDTASMLLALSALQIDVLRNTFSAIMSNTRQRQEQLQKCGDAVSKVTVIHVTVQSQELDAIGSTLEKLSQLQAQESGTVDLDPAAETNLIHWAKQRGLTFPSLTDSLSNVTSVIGDAITKTPVLGDLANAFSSIIDKATDEIENVLSIPVKEALDWVQKNVTEVESYLRSVQENRADNARITQLIAQSPGLERLYKDLGKLGYSEPLVSLGNLVQASTSLSIQLRSIQQDLQRSSAQVRIVGNAVREKSNQIQQFASKSIQHDLRRSNLLHQRELDQMRRELNQLEDMELQRELLDEMLETLLELEQIEALGIDVQSLKSGHIQAFQGADWSEVQQQADHWKTDLQSQLKHASN